MITESQQSIVDGYVAILKEQHRLPTKSEFLHRGITDHKIRHHFGNITNLHKFIKTEHADLLDKNILTSESLFTPKRFKELKATIRKKKTFVISTAVENKPVDTKFLAAIRNFCNKKDAELLVFPVKDIVSRKKGEAFYYLPSEISDDHYIFDDVEINKNLFLSSIKLSAKHINPLTGLSRIGQRNGTFIYGSPKQFLEFVATSADKSRMPHALMTTGALTLPDYDNERYMSDRTSYIAENDHVIGGIIVEVVNDKEFHFRQIQADKDGSFIDLGVRYTDKKAEKVKATLVMGDYHAGATDLVVKDATAVLAKKVELSSIILHDFFDGYCINHHEANMPLKVAQKTNANLAGLKEELKLGGVELNWLQTLTKGNLVIVKSNHDEFLDRYLWGAKYVSDPQNHYIALDLAQRMLEGQDPLRYGYETYGNLKNPKRIIWLERDEEFKIGGVEAGQHGDKGANGSQGSLLGLEKAYGICVVGHAHSAAILRGVTRVGTSSKLKLSYNTGPSSWTQSHCLLYENGSRQLVHCINGRFFRG